MACQFGPPLGRCGHHHQGIEAAGVPHGRPPDGGRSGRECQPAAWGLQKLLTKFAGCLIMRCPASQARLEQVSVQIRVGLSGIYLPIRVARCLLQWQQRDLPSKVPCIEELRPKTGSHDVAHSGERTQHPEHEPWIKVEAVRHNLPARSVCDDGQVDAFEIPGEDREQVGGRKPLLDSCQIFPEPFSVEFLPLAGNCEGPGTARNIAGINPKRPDPVEERRTNCLNWSTDFLTLSEMPAVSAELRSSEPCRAAKCRVVVRPPRDNVPGHHT